METHIDGVVEIYVCSYNFWYQGIIYVVGFYFKYLNTHIKYLPWF